jgi:hypothetical protein
MSQRDVLTELRAAKVAAPAEVRQRVRAIAAAAPPEPKRFTWRRALVVAVPVAAAVAATIVFTRPASHPSATQTFERAVGAPAAQAHGADKAFSVPAARQRVQLVGTTLSLRTRDISGGVRRAVGIVTSLGGYPASVHADLHTADLTLKVPRSHVQQAMTRLSQLGTITGENLDVQDLTAGLNATDREIARLQKELAQLRAAGAPASKIAALTARIQSLQRAQADTRRTAHYATIGLHLATPRAAHAQHGHGPLHGVVVALTWLGIGAVYTLAVGAPVVVLLVLVWLAVRLVRRRREDELLSRS